MGTNFKSMLEAFAAGDAMGMPTEFMTKEYIRDRFGLIDRILEPSVSTIHGNLFKGQITDDTEQVLYLIDSYSRNRGVSVGATVDALARWIKETNPVEKGYIGPSSKRALERIEAGEDPEIAGKGGTTCGAPMRVVAAALCVRKGDFPALEKAIRSCSLPTHNTSVAMESAAALGFAFHAAASGADFEGIVDAAMRGSMAGRSMSTEKYVGAYSGAKFSYALETIRKLGRPEEVIDFVYDVIGTTMESNDITPAALSIFAWAKKDVWMAVRLGASIGGDTDTIAAIAGALSALYARGHNIPHEIVNQVITSNRLSLEEYSVKIDSLFRG